MYNGRKLQTEAGLHVALYFQKFENPTFKFKKIWKKILDVDNDELYKHAKSQCKIVFIVDYIKITKSGKFYSFKICTIHYSQIYTFVIFVYPKLLIISDWDFTCLWIPSLATSRIFSDFSKFKTIKFKILKIKGYMYLGLYLSTLI
jgi:hypothetical protein